jgi:hypothetical protein
LAARAAEAAALGACVAALLAVRGAADAAARAQASAAQAAAEVAALTAFLHHACPPRFRWGALGFPSSVGSAFADDDYDKDLHNAVRRRKHPSTQTHSHS